MQKMGRATMSAAAVALGTVALAGTALACGCGHKSEASHEASSWGHSSHSSGHNVHGDGGNAGNGGAANANCAVPVGISAGIIGQGGDTTQCNAVGGNGGNGGGGVSY